MTKRQIVSFVLIIVISQVFFNCEGMATLFHGEKPGVTFTVTFNANGAAGNPPAAQNVKNGAVIRLPDNSGMTSAGNVFAGWNESSGGTGVTYSVGASITVISDMVFYAQWIDALTPKYTVTFNANGATSGTAPAPQTVYSGISITIPEQGTLAHSAKTFGGWNTQANGGGTNYEVGAAYTVTGNVTLYARWKSDVQYTVTYNANGASGTAPAKQSVDPGTVITLPGAGSMVNSGKTFDGWNTQADGGGTNYAEGAAYTVNANATFYAVWLSEPIEPPGATLVEKLAYIRSNAGNGVIYDIVVNNNEYIGPQTVGTLGRNITVIIHSASSADVKTIQLESVGNLLTVDNNITLKLQDIVLKGMTNNNKALVWIGTGGKMIMDSGSKITLNTNTSGGLGGGIYMSGSVLEMNEGAEIIGNIVSSSYSYGGGIYVADNSNVRIYGGLISENKCAGTGNSGRGGGIYITSNSKSNSTVIMSGGTISKNTCRAGGGIYVDTAYCSFTKRAVSGNSTSGIIYGGTGDNANIADYSGGHAVFRAFGSSGTKQQRNSTLGYYDEITSSSDEGWEQ